MSPSPLHKIHAHYAPRVNPRQPGWQILDWASEASQHARFDALLRALHALPPPPPATLLDVGCGTADLLPWLAQRLPSLRYTGLDLLPEVTAEARRRHPAAHLLTANLFDPPSLPPDLADRTFDIVYCSGAFNLDLGNNDTFLQTALPILWSHTSRLLVFNLLHTRTTRKYNGCHYYDPVAILDLCHQLTPNVTLDDTYLQNDFTIIMANG